MSAPKDQHFLIDVRAIERIASSVDVAKRSVLEIGPGAGSLTRALLKRSAQVTAVEIDPVLCGELEIDFSEEIGDGRLNLICGDFLKVEVPPFEIVVANLPYSASSKITFRLLERGFETAVLMYQKEFADRMLARIGTPDCGRLSVMVQTFAEVEPLFELSPNAFRPKPQVRSKVVRITPREPPYPLNNEKVYADVVRVLFSHRRKTVRKALKSGRGEFTADALARMLTSVPEDILNSRPEELSLADFAAIANVV